MVKKILFLFALLVLFECPKAQNAYFYNGGNPIYYKEDKCSAIIIVSGDSSAVLDVGNRLKNWIDTTKYSVYFTPDDNVVFLYGDSLGVVSVDSIKKQASGDGTDSIVFFSYAKDINGTHLWLRNEILIELKENTGIQSICQLLRDYDVNIILDTLNEYIIQCKNENELIYLSNAIYESGLVIYSAPDYYGGIALHSIPPSDPKYSYQYYLNNTGQAIPTLISNSEYGSAGMDIKAVNAWMFVQYLHNNLGNAIKVAVIDDGVEDHEDLMTGSSNRVLQGWTCGGGNGHPMDNSLHGQCVAGIIAASHNDKGVAGIAPNTEIIPICIQKDHSFLHLSFNGPYYSCFYSFGKIARAIRKAWNKFGAEILNNSWGSTVFIHDKILRAFEKAANKGRDGKGCVITASAGNESSTTNTNEIGRMPYSINVGAIDKNGFRTSYSNYSSGNQPGVDIVAFGGRFDKSYYNWI